MRIGEFIYNLDGQPFSSIDRAKRMADLLSVETRANYKVQDWINDGYVVVGPLPQVPANAERSSKLSHPAQCAIVETVDNSREIQQYPSSRQVNHYELRQAIFRTNLKALLIMVINVFMMIFPGEILTYVLQAVKLSPLDAGAGWPVIQQVLQGTGAVIFTFMGLALFWQWSSAVYRITDFGVEARIGIFAHQTIGLRFQDIRSSSIKQSITDRLLNIGLIEFASAGTDGIPVQFRNVANPGKVMQRVKARMGQSSVD